MPKTLQSLKHVLGVLEWFCIMHALAYSCKISISIYKDYKDLAYRWGPLLLVHTSENRVWVDTYSYERGEVPLLGKQMQRWGTEREKVHCKMICDVNKCKGAAKQANIFGLGSTAAEDEGEGGEGGLDTDRMKVRAIGWRRGWTGWRWEGTGDKLTNSAFHPWDLVVCSWSSSSRVKLK